MDKDFGVTQGTLEIYNVSPTFLYRSGIDASRIYISRVIQKSLAKATEAALDKHNDQFDEEE